MHQADERVPVAELRQLASIYRAVLDDFAAGPAS
jgi:acetylornithine deacetylase/succinyl-diaminopimelate desuccinylase-like protein